MRPDSGAGREKQCSTEAEFRLWVLRAVAVVSRTGVGSGAGQRSVTCTGSAGSGQTWALGYFRAKVMMGSLCSRAKVGSTMYRTGPSASSCARNSAVGKTGACTHRAPSDSLPDTWNGIPGTSAG